MACLKCGRELAEGQSFCDSCRQDMIQDPVRPDTPAHIIPRPKDPVEKKTSRKEKPSDKEAHKHLRSAIQWLIVTVAILTVIVCVLAGLLLSDLQPKPDPEQNAIGQNYTVITGEK